MTKTNEKEMQNIFDWFWQQDCVSRVGESTYRRYQSYGEKGEIPITIVTELCFFENCLDDRKYVVVRISKKIGGAINGGVDYVVLSKLEDVIKFIERKLEEYKKTDKNLKLGGKE